MIIKIIVTRYNCYTC